jgi:hypothetical protein
LARWAERRSIARPRIPRQRLPWGIREGRNEESSKDWWMDKRDLEDLLLERLVRG